MNATELKAEMTETDKPDMTVVSSPEPIVAGPVLKKKELIEAVTERVDLKKPQVKMVVEAMLEVLGDAMAEGRELNLNPMGKMIPKRVKEGRNANVTTLRLRQSKDTGEDQTTGDAADEKALAEGDDQS